MKEDKILHNALRLARRESTKGVHDQNISDVFLGVCVCMCLEAEVGGGGWGVGGCKLK